MAVHWTKSEKVKVPEADFKSYSDWQKTERYKELLREQYERSTKQ